jgi:hypothetical protein
MRWKNNSRHFLQKNKAETINSIKYEMCFYVSICTILYMKTYLSLVKTLFFSIQIIHVYQKQKQKFNWVFGLGSRKLNWPPKIKNLKKSHVFLI